MTSVSICSDSVYLNYVGVNPKISRIKPSKRILFDGRMKSQKIKYAGKTILISSDRKNSYVSVFPTMKKIIRLKFPKSIKLSNMGRHKRVISIDAGHGGIDPGTIYHKLKEKDIVLRYAITLREKLIKMGYGVVFTRPKGKMSKQRELDYRVKKSNKAKSDLFLSIHVNSMKKNSRVHGVEIYYRGRISKSISEELSKNLSKINKVKKIKSSGFYVLKHTKSPSILLEVGFLSNYSDRRKLVSNRYIDKITSAIAKTIKKKLPERGISCRKFKVR